MDSVTQQYIQQIKLLGVFGPRKLLCTRLFTQNPIQGIFSTPRLPRTATEKESISNRKPEDISKASTSTTGVTTSPSAFSCAHLKNKSSMIQFMLNKLKGYTTSNNDRATTNLLIHSRPNCITSINIRFLSASNDKIRRKKLS